MPEKFENATTTNHVLFVLKQNSGGEITHTIVFENDFPKCFPSKRQRKANVFKFLRLKRVFEKLRFQISPAWCNPGLKNKLETNTLTVDR